MSEKKYTLKKIVSNTNLLSGYLNNLAIINPKSSVLVSCEYYRNLNSLVSYTPVKEKKPKKNYWVIHY